MDSSYHKLFSFLPDLAFALVEMVLLKNAIFLFWECNKINFLSKKACQLKARFFWEWIFFLCRYYLFEVILKHLTIYFNLYICLSLWPVASGVCLTFKFPIPTVISQNVTNKSHLECVKSKKICILVNLRPLGSMKQGKAKIHALQYWLRQSQAV